MFVWVNLNQNSKTGQDASAWGTEGLALTKCRFLLKAKAFYFRYFGGCESTRYSFD